MKHQENVSFRLKTLCLGQKNSEKNICFPQKKLFFLPSVEKTTIFSSGNKSSPQSCSVPGIKFSPRRNIYSSQLELNGWYLLNFPTFGHLLVSIHWPFRKPMPKSCWISSAVKNTSSIWTKPSLVCETPKKTQKILLTSNYNVLHIIKQMLFFGGNHESQNLIRVHITP